MQVEGRCAAQQGIFLKGWLVVSLYTISTSGDLVGAGSKTSKNSRRKKMESI